MFAAIATLVSGCATMSNGLSGDISRSMAEVASATETASLAFEQHTKDLATDAASSTTLGNMLDEILTASTAVAELDVATDKDLRLRAEASETIRECVDAVNAARRSVGAGGGSDGALVGLRDAADRATGLSDDLERYR